MHLVIILVAVEWIITLVKNVQRWTVPMNLSQHEEERIVLQIWLDYKESMRALQQLHNLISVALQIWTLDPAVRISLRLN